MSSPRHAAAATAFASASAGAGIPNASTSSSASSRTSRAQRVDVLDGRLRALRREAAVLLEPAALGLDPVQRVQAAQAVEHRAQRGVVAVVDRAGELLEHDEVDPRAGDVDDVVLAVDEHGERVLPASIPPFSRRAAPARMCSWRQRISSSWVSRVEQVGAVVAAGEQPVGEPGEQAARRGALGDDLDRLTAEELRHAERVELAELVAVVGEQVLRAELEQDGVVALERREDVGVGLQRGEAVGLAGSRRRRTPRGTSGSCRSRARWRPP